MKGIEERDKMVNDYTDGKRKPKNPDTLGPPISYMEECGVFQPLSFYDQSSGAMSFLLHVDPNVSHAYRSKATSHCGTCKEATDPCQYKATAVYPRGLLKVGLLLPLGLLQELHTRSALVCIPIHLPGEGKDRHSPRVSCCPFCAYTIQNDPAYLNHIVCVHYDASFTCGACLSAITSSGQQMKTHIKECSGLAPLPTASQESVPSGHSPKKSAPGSKHARGKKKGSHSEKSQPAGQDSQDSQASDRHITRATGTSQETMAESTGRRTRHKRKKAKSHKENKSGK